MGRKPKDVGARARQTSVRITEETDLLWNRVAGRLGISKVAALEMIVREKATALGIDLEDEFYDVVRVFLKKPSILSAVERKGIILAALKKIGAESGEQAEVECENCKGKFLPQEIQVHRASSIEDKEQKFVLLCALCHSRIDHS